MLQQNRVLPHYRCEFDQTLQKTTRTRIEGPKLLRTFLMELAGVKMEKAQRSHREALMTFFSLYDKERMLKTDTILEYYRTNEKCTSKGA